MKQQLDYTIVDVFADRPLEGNPLAVFHDGRGLSDEQMQAIARETNLSETTFVLPSGDPEQDREQGVRVRIFTTQEELPFAGHPSLGTASWLHLHHPPVAGATDIKLLLNVGPIPIRFGQDAVAQANDGVFATMWQNDPVFGELHDRGEVARILGVQEPDLLENAPPQTVSTGNPFCIVALKLEALQRLAIPQREATEWLRARRIRWFYCIAPEESEGAQTEATHTATATQTATAMHTATATQTAIWRARMQWNAGEDPATGSAAGPAIAWLVQHGLADPGAQVTLRQGLEISRPSRLLVRAERQGASVGCITVSGSTIPVAHGAFFLSV